MQTGIEFSDLLTEIGGEPLADSGFEQELPEAAFVPEEV